MKTKIISTFNILAKLFFLVFPLVSAWSHSVGAGDRPGGNPEEIRESVIAGTWYPGSAAELRKQIEDFLGRATTPELPGPLNALIAPHAGYVFSGQVAAYAYKLLEKQRFESVIVLAPSHHARFTGVSVYDRGGFRTPLGEVPLDYALIEALEKRDGRIRFVREAHVKEHALEIQLPFLQVLMPGFKLVPLVMGEQDYSSSQWLAEAIADCVRGKSVLVVASSDLSHYRTYEEAKQLDQILMDKVNAFDPRGMYEKLSQGQCEACGGGPMLAAMLIARSQGATSSRVLHYANSGDVSNDRNRVVGYLAAAFWTGPPLKADSQAGAKKAGVDLGLTAEEKALLHRIVKETIEARCRGTKPPPFEPVTPILKQQRGAFVTLHKHGELRGCIGSIMSDRPLVETVTEMALAAAFRDPRFPAVTPDELKELDYEISVLTPLRKIKDVREIQVGVHGIFLRGDGRSGLLLPQVATENGWDRNAFLQNTCRKAGLPSEAWKDQSTEIFIFSADVF